MKTLGTISACLILSSCAFLPSIKNKLEIRPVNITACSPPSNPMLPCGWLTAELGETEDFVVTAGWGMFDEVVGSENTKHPHSEKTIKIFSEFAIRHVVTMGYCEAATFVRQERGLFTFEGSGDRGVHIKCK